LPARKKLLVLLSAALLAFSLCGPAPAADRTSADPGKKGASVKTKAKPEHGKTVKSGKRRARAGKDAGKPGKKPRSRFRTPPPGTGYGNLDPERQVNPSRSGEKRN